MHEDRGWTRGHAHVAFDDIPKGAPGYLDMPPIKLAVFQEVDPGAGYPTHHHENVDTLLVVLQGAMLHEDSLGNRARCAAGSVYALSAGSGIDHSEFAEVFDEPKRTTRAVMFWVRPQHFLQPPRFLSKCFPRAERTNELVTLASGRRNAPPDALPVRQDVALLGVALTAGAELIHTLAPGRSAYLLNTDGEIEVNGRVVRAGERVLVRDIQRLALRARTDTELFLLDVPR